MDTIARQPRQPNLPETGGQATGDYPRTSFDVRAAAIALGAAACLSASAALAAELPTYTVVAKDGRLTPTILNVPAQTRFKIVVRNDGDTPIEFESLSLRKEKVLAPGAQSFVVVAPLRPGEYAYFDDFHPDSGRGRVVVK